MPFWKESTEDKQRKENNEASQRALEEGQIPPIARHRIAMQQKETSRFFTSDLSSNEHLLTREAGYEPIGLVMGSAFYKVSFWGYYNSYYLSSGELSVLSQAQMAARSLALNRLQQEASLLGAHGVIGVRLKVGQYDRNTRSVEFTAIGTAIRIAQRPPENIPFTSALSGQEFWQLYQAGYYPRGLVFGACSYYIHTDWNTRNITSGGLFGMFAFQNQEIAQYTNGFLKARHLAMSRLSNDTQKLGADGAIGTKIEMEIEDIEYEVNETTYRDLLIHFLALGTAIASDHHVDKPTAKSPLLYLDLATGKTNRI
ncbi:MAG: heavy metal-binding domain-containing protein [Cyanobacteriota bacterium ELA615]